MQTFTRDGLTFDVRIGGPETGTPVLLLHGFPQDSRAWDGVRTRLHESGFRTFAPDQRGYSPGARPDGRNAYRQREVVEDAVALLDAFGLPQAHVVGHDWGGFVAWGLASEFPERCTSLTVLSTPHPGAFKSVALSSTQMLKSWYMGLFQVPGVSERLLRPNSPMWNAMCRGLPREQAEHYAERLSEPGALTAALNWYRAMPLDLRGSSLPMHRISVPTLYLWGDKDPALGKAAAEATATFVTGKYKFIPMPGVGHWVPERQPEAVHDAAVEFWNET